MASLKKREKPNSIFHVSVGTERTIKHRKEQLQLLHNLKLNRETMLPYVLSDEMLRKWDYLLSVPDGLGGSQPSEEGKTKICERCRKQFIVKRKEEAEECIFHWGRTYSSRVNGKLFLLFSFLPF